MGMRLAMTGENGQPVTDRLRMTVAPHPMVVGPCHLRVVNISIADVKLVACAW